MSFLLAYSFHSVGFILADTRLNSTFTNGQKAFSDTSPSTILLENGDSLSWGLKYRKMSPIKTGWCAAAGDAITSKKIINILSTAPFMPLEKKASIISIESKKMIPWLPKDTQANEELRRTILFFLEYVDDVLKLSTIDIDGNITNQDVNFAVAWPPELSNSKLTELTQTVSDVSCPKSTEELFDLILFSLNVFQEVYQNSLTVSRTFEVAVLIPQPEKRINLYGFDDVENILQKGIAGIAEMLSKKKG